MLNYIWLALLFLGISAALTVDVIDKSQNRFRNNEPIQIEFTIASQEIDEQKPEQIQISINQSQFNDFYKTKFKMQTVEQTAQISFDEKENNFGFYLITDSRTPDIWKEMAKVNGKENDLTGKLLNIKQTAAQSFAADLILEEISFSKMKSVTNSAIEYAAVAVNIALGLIGIMALWLGIMKIAEQAGLISLIAKSVKPITKFLFPDVPYDHPAIGSIIMNISANMLGLGNAATPFGLKAMEELDSINPNKGTATNAMCTFLAINTAGLTLIPATAIAIRAAAGSSEPAIIIGTSFFGALCATITGITAAKILEKFPLKFSEVLTGVKNNLKKILIAAALIVIVIVLSLSGLLRSLSTFINVDLLKNIIQMVSTVAIPLIIILFVTYGIIKKVKIYEVFVEGAKEGFNVAIRIIPFLVAMLVAIGISRAGGAMDILVLVLSPITNLIGMPAEALPMALMRPLSGSGSLGIMSEIISVHGPDSFIGLLVSTIMGSTETTFYVLALYFGVVNIKRIRHAAAAGILADIAGVLGALFIIKLIFG